MPKTPVLSRLYFIFTLALLIPFASQGKALPEGQASKRPNILWITVEDVGPHLGSYGNPDAITPHLDNLAAESQVFTRAYSTAGVCAPSKASLISGVYASTFGAQHMRGTATLPPEIKILPALLREKGYYCTNNFNEDYNFPVPDRSWHESDKQAHWRNRPEGMPFFSAFNITITHERFLRESDKSYNKITRELTPNQRRIPERVSLPPWLPDTPTVRKEWARYHELITVMDLQVGKLLEQLRKDGLREDTIIIFSSDHGPPLPRAKQFNFDSGLSVPLIIHIPEKWQHLASIRGGSINDDLISLVDLPPTLLSILGFPVPEVMQGLIFLGNSKGEPRQTIHSIRDRMDERIDMSRTVSDGRYKYHRNYMPHLPHYPNLKYMDRLGTAKEFRRLSAERALPPGLSYFMASKKELEELYDLNKDPHELNNLAGEPEYKEILAYYREKHFEWILETRDTGLIPEYMLRQFSSGSSEYAYGQSDAYDISKILSVARLFEKGDDAIPNLLEFLADPYPPVRYWSAMGLNYLNANSSEVADALTDLLSDPHPEIALTAVEALCQIGETEPALPVIARNLQHEAALVRLFAANVLERIGGKALPLLPHAQKAIKHEESQGISLSVMVHWALESAIKKIKRLSSSKLIPVGLSKVDITPSFPVRLHAFPRGPRVNSVNEIAQGIYAKAIVFGESNEDPAILINADILGFSQEIRIKLFERLQKRIQLQDLSQLTLTAAHNHSAPAIRSVAPYVFRQPPSKSQMDEILRYEDWLLDQLETAVIDAWNNREPSLLSYSKTSADFAINRRVIKDGKWTAFGEVPNAPVIHEAPLISIFGSDGEIRALWVNYASHAVCWRHPSIHGDWVGVANEEIEAAFPGALSIITIGCAGDINPVNATGNDPYTPGRELAESVIQQVKIPGRMITKAPTVKTKTFDLPLQEPPGMEFWANRNDWYSQEATKKLKQRETLPQQVPLFAQSWNFGEDLNIVFLAGEVFAKYDQLIKSHLVKDRTFIVAYANDMPGYIPTAEAIPEGGFEIDASRYSYGLPARFDPRIENIIVRNVIDMIPDSLKGENSKIEVNKSWWEKTGHPKGKWWESYDGYEPEEAQKLWEKIPIPPAPVLLPEKALETFALNEHFRIELVAAEPMVINPVFMRFDELGRLWVVEMPGYMRDIDGTGERDPSGRIMVLEDSDGDARMDKATTFMDGLVMPRSLAFVRSGILVIEPPYLWLVRDLNGNLHADQKIMLLDNFGDVSNPEHSENGLMRAIDNWLYNAKSNQRFQFDGENLISEITAFRGQWGITQDNTGRLYYNYNASPLHTDLVPAEYLIQKNGLNLTKIRYKRQRPFINVSLSDNIPVHPIRVNPLVTLGASDLRPDGTLKQFSAASAPHYYRGGLFPEEFSQSVFVAEPVGNLIKHFSIIEENDLPLSAIPKDENGEFLASTDERFRPVAIEGGPDGALYVADMHVGIIEHKRYVTPYLRDQVMSRPEIGEFTETGRIYRIVPTDYDEPYGNPLKETDPRSLVSKLSHPNGWVRDTAQRLLVDGRQEEIVPELIEIVQRGESYQGRLHALWTLQGLNRVSQEALAASIDDKRPEIQIATLRILDKLGNSIHLKFQDSLSKLISNTNSELRLQLILTFGRLPSTHGWPLITKMLKQYDDWWLPSATAAAVQRNEPEFLESLHRNGLLNTSSEKWKNLLIQLAGNTISRKQPNEVALLFSTYEIIADKDWRSNAMLQGMTSQPTFGDPILLDSAPPILSMLQQSDDPKLLSYSEKLASIVTWPGDDSSKPENLVEWTESEQRLITSGRELYKKHCSVCHGTDGQGQIGLAPPIAGTKWTTGPVRVPVEIIIHGLSGPIEVANEEWNSAMPGLEHLLDNEDVASIVTYIRRELNAGLPGLSPKEVQSIRSSSTRTRPWTAPELEAFVGE